MYQRFSCYVINLLLFNTAAALNFPQDLSSAIEQSAVLLNNTNILILNNTPAVSGYVEATDLNSTPHLNLTAPSLPLNDTLLKDTHLYCNRQTYGTVSYASCLDALDTLHITSSRVYTFGQRDAGLFDFNLPFRLQSCRVSHSLLSLSA